MRAGGCLPSSAVPEEPPIGSFLSWHLIDGARYEVFARHGEPDGFARFDIYDEDGNHINEEFVLELPPTDLTVAGLAQRWRARRTVLVRPSPHGWVVIWVGDVVRIAVATSWWPR
jgi:hypothetical protein